MKLTKAQRHKIYKQTKIAHIDSQGHWPNFYLCCAIRYTMDLLGLEAPSDSGIIDSFPEFASKKPIITDSQSTAWWKKSDSKSRLKAINACIRETAPKKRKKVSNQTKSKQ